ncbi:Ionotropic receptor 707 [Blattella germanica]|nr:Ionotropic receptor 707 [Blattella germanica]
MIRKIILLLTVVFIPTMLMTPLEIMICLQEIISKEFCPGKVLVFSLPSTIPLGDMSIIDEAISNISSKEMWPLLISSDSQSTDADIPELHHGYVIFLLPDEDIITSLEVQIEDLQTFSFSYNRRAKFIIVVLLEDNDDPHNLSKEILNTIWIKDNIVNAVVVVRAVDIHDAQKNEETKVYDIYSLFPFRSEYCGESNDTDLLDQWTLSKGFLNGNKLMHEKLPNDLLGCVLLIDIYHVPPFVFIKENYIDTQKYDFDGISVVFLNFISEAMKFSTKFLIDKGWDGVIGRMMDGRGIGVAAYVMLPQSYSYADLSIPYAFTNYLLYVPCAKKNPSSGNVLKVFSTAVWLVSVSVLLLVSILFFILQRNDPKVAGYKTWLSCILNVWAVFLSASVPSMPMASQFRMFFFTFLCFCFALNTIFQSFFTSYLIDTGYERQIESIEDLNEIGVTFLSNENIFFTEQFTGVRFISNFKYTKLCESYDECCMEMLKFQNSSILEDKFKIEYYASIVRVDGLCTIWRYDTTGYVIPVSRGHPILGKFNYLIQKCLENGCFERYWSLFLWSNRVLSANNDNEESFSYSSFGLEHIQICFSFLVIGYILSICTLCSEHVCYRYYNK